MTNLSDTLKASAPDAEQLQAWRTQLGCSFPQIDGIFADCMVDAQAKLSTEGLDEGISTRMLIYAGSLIAKGVAAQAACRVALVRPITDDPDMRDALDAAVATFF